MKKNRNESSGLTLEQKLTLKHLVRATKDDLEATSSNGIEELIFRWKKRFKSRPPSKTLISVLVKKLLNILPNLFRRRLLVRRLKRSTTLFANLDVVDKDFLESLNSSLSIVINTKNSPPFFEEIIEKYTHQVGFKKVEIIIVDSGSTDNTLHIAKKYGCKIIEIKPEAFRHGRSRNIGIEAATGDYIVNTVSDAIPATSDLCYKVALKLDEEKAAAVSVRQIPRFDADLFAIWSFWQHYQFIFNGSPEDLWVDGVKNYKKLSDIEQRRLATIDDVFVLHKGSVISKEKYDNDIRYAEDVLLSIAYIKKGLKIGFIQSEAVIHSHSRTPEYFLKRYFVDGNVVNEVFGTVSQMLTNKDLDLNPSETRNDIYSMIYALKQNLEANMQDGSWVSTYLDFFSEKKVNKKIESNWKIINELIYGKFEDFLKLTNSKLSGHEDVRSRVAAMVTGTMLSEYLIRLNLKSQLPSDLNKFMVFLENGI